ncbi:hypothetical protein HYT05_01960 [Candidatus Kaiserbacteria bacterium]|nr:hypothetical protein [Candidatus Kaiserbacteria bacterium]
MGRHNVYVETLVMIALMGFILYTGFPNFVAWPAVSMSTLIHVGSIGAVFVSALIGVFNMNEDTVGFDRKPFTAFALMAIAASVWFFTSSGFTEVLASLVFILGGLVGALVNSGYKRS